MFRRKRIEKGVSEVTMGDLHGSGRGGYLDNDLQ